MRTAIAYGLALLSIGVFGALRLRPSNGERHDASGSANVSGEPSAVAPAPATPESWVGVVVAGRTVELTSKAGGVLRDMSVNAGDSVRKGALLGEVDARDKAAALRVASAMHRGQADRAARSQKLLAADLVSREDALGAQFDAERRAAELGLASVVFDDAKMRAPFDGVVVTRYVDPGGYVMSGAPVVRLADLSSGWIRFGVGQTDVRDIAIGQSVYAIDVAGHVASAIVQSISPEVDLSAGRVVVHARTGSLRESGMRSGGLVRVSRQPPGPHPSLNEPVR